MKAKPKFKIGDRVKVLIGTEYMRGKTATITKITENDKDFMPKEGEEFIYFIDGEERYYNFAYFFEIDKEWDRNEKLNKILNMGYHKSEIPRGVYGEFSKIREEFLESEDALEQDNKIMLMVELSDLIGSIEAYCNKHHNITLDDLITMKEATKRAFTDGTREPRE